MALRDVIDIFETEGQVPIAGSWDQRVWTEQNDLLETDYYREVIDIETWQYPGCTLEAVEGAKADVSEVLAEESPSQTTVITGRYFVDNRKTMPRAYTFEVTLEIRDRYKNGEQMPDPEI